MLSEAACASIFDQRTGGWSERRESDERNDRGDVLGVPGEGTSLNAAPVIDKISDGHFGDLPRKTGGG